MWSRIVRAAGERIAAWRQRHPRLSDLALLAGRSVRSIVRTRVIGLAAESAFFSLLSLPALLLGLVGTLGHLRPVLGAATVLEIRAWLLDLAATVLTSDTVDSVVAPLIDEFLQGAQGGLLSVTFLVSLWSGSRAMSVFIDAITIAYGLDELRGYVRQRLLALLAYIGGLLFALVLLPVLVAGPDLVHELLPATSPIVRLLYWPVIGGLSTLAVAMLYVLSTPVRTPGWRYLPGALTAMLVLLGGSVLLRVYLDASFGQVSIYGSLAAPIAILVWLWLMALAVLIGSALNAEIDAMWPTPRTAAARAEVAALRHARARRMVQRREEALQAVGEVGEAPAETLAELAVRMRRLLGRGAERHREAGAGAPAAGGGPAAGVGGTQQAAHEPPAAPTPDRTAPGHQAQQQANPGPNGGPDATPPAPRSGADEGDSSEGRARAAEAESAIPGSETREALEVQQDRPASDGSGDRDRPGA